MKQIRISTLIMASLIIVTSACHKKPELPASNYTNGTGVYIFHEGQFNHNNGSVSFFNKKDSTVTNNLYEAANNNTPLGDIVQSMTLYSNKGYIVVNNSQKVEIVNLDNFRHEATLTGLSSPRYLYVVDFRKAYISDWISNNIKIVNLSTNAITGTIATGAGPEQMIRYGNSIYVANNGGFGDDSTVFVIDVITNTVTDTIYTAALKPTAMKLDKNNKLWILCSGSYGADYTVTTDDTPAKLVMVDPSTNTVLQSVVIGNLGDHPFRLAINKTKDILYYENFGIYKMAITDVTAPTLPFITKNFYGIDVDPNTDIIYGADAKDFTVKGEIYKYSNTGVFMDSYSVGIVPSGFVFN
jgi:YVTN family beta-propeller protein